MSVRIGQSVDIVGKAGNPKSIVGGHVQTTPVLLCAGEKAELASDQYESLSGVLEGFVILREKVGPHCTYSASTCAQVKARILLQSAMA